jgi:hypothetical protein
MQITELGRKAVNHPQVRAHFLDIAITQLQFHKCPVAEFEEGLRFIVANYLAAVPTKRGLGFRMAGDIDGVDEFLVEHTSIIEPIVKDTIKRALAEGAGMGLE